LEDAIVTQSSSIIVAIAASLLFACCQANAEPQRGSDSSASSSTGNPLEKLGIMQFKARVEISVNIFAHKQLADFITLADFRPVTVSAKNEVALSGVMCSAVSNVDELDWRYRTAEQDGIVTIEFFDKECLETNIASEFPAPEKGEKTKLLKGEKTRITIRFSQIDTLRVKEIRLLVNETVALKPDVFLTSGALSKVTEDGGSFEIKDVFSDNMLHIRSSSETWVYAGKATKVSQLKEKDQVTVLYRRSGDKLTAIGIAELEFNLGKVSGIKDGKGASTLLFLDTKKTGNLPVAASTRVYINGKRARISDLKEGDKCAVASLAPPNSTVRYIDCRRD
jgi:Cu/Ag efflux protein CusF